MIVCNKPLRCGLHNCMDLCHRGPCGPCLDSTMDEVTCECGASVIYPPVPCGTPIPTCTRPCSRVRPCEHVSGHPCHTGPCPPCVELIPKPCACGSRVFPAVQCSRAVSCGTICKKPLSCGRHECPRACHAGDCLPEGTACPSKCGATRSCGHTCEAACHGNSDCPGECKETKRWQCTCGRIVKNEWCDGTPLAGLECDQQCIETIEVVTRNEKLAAALGIRPDESFFAKERAKFTLEQVVAGRQMPNLVLRMEKRLAQLIKDAKTPEKKTSGVLPAMSGEERRLVAQMAERYGVAAHLHYIGPKRALELVPSDEAAVPPLLLSEACRTQFVGLDASELLQAFKQDLLFFTFDDPSDSTNSEEVRRAIRLFGEYRMYLSPSSTATAMHPLHHIHCTTRHHVHTLAAPHPLHHTVTTHSTEGERV